MAVSVHGDICASPSRRADSLREINETEIAERPGWMWGPRNPKSPEISAICAAARGRLGAEIQNLSESTSLAIVGHVRSFILIIRRQSHAVAFVPRDLSISLRYRRGYSEECVDPGRRTKIFQNF